MADKREQKKNGTASMAGLLERFPEYRLPLERLWSADADFQHLCDEYQDCAIALSYWRDSPAAEASRLRAEYTALLQDLETEILGYLEKCNEGGESPRPVN